MLSSKAPKNRPDATYYKNFLDQRFWREDDGLVSPRQSKLFLVGLCLSLGLLSGCDGDQNASAAASPDFGSAYLSSSVEKDVERLDIYGNTRLRVDFDHDLNYRDVVRFNAGCNSFGAELEIENERIVTGSVDSTLVQCSFLALESQDTFFARFFQADPAYVLSGNELRLTARDMVIDLKQRP